MRTFKWLNKSEWNKLSSQKFRISVKEEINVIRRSVLLENINFL